MSRLQAHIGRLLDPVRAGQSDRIAGLEAEVERLREERNEWRRISAEQQADYGQLQVEVERLHEDYEAMRLEWSKSVDERDGALAEVKRLREAAELARIELDTALGLWERVPHDAHLCVERARRTLDITAPTTEGEQ